MPDKAYAVLIDWDSGYLYFPIKRSNPYADMPVFFGGTKNGGESDRECIAREMLEESDEKLTLEAGDLTRVHSANVGGSTLNFYVSGSWSGNDFLGPLENAEMKRIDRFYVEEGGEDTVEDLLHRLDIVPTQEFTQSETYTAWDYALAYCAGEGRAARAMPLPEPS